MAILKRKDMHHFDTTPDRPTKRRANADDFLTGHCNTSVTLPVFDCIICADTIYAQQNIPINDHEVCGGCFDRKGGYREQFEAHLLNEMYQPKIGGNRINFYALQEVFPSNFIRAYHKRLFEYAVAADRRVYCAEKTCSQFLGASGDLFPRVSCDHGHFTCGLCASSIASRRADHVCKEPEAEVDAFEGLKRGVDYQKCPKCPAKVELAEACNHMKCICGGQFCFICGQSAEEEDAHWMRALGCPRYGAKGSPNAIYDDDPGSQHEVNMQHHIDLVIDERRVEGLSDNLHEDVYEYASPPTDPRRDPLVPARRAYRQYLYDIVLDISKMNEANIDNGMDIDRSKAMLYPVYHAAMSVLVSLDYFTAHLEPDQNGRGAHRRYFRHLRPERHAFDRNLPQITSGQFAQFPGLANIFTAYQLAEDNRIDELRDYVYIQRDLGIL